MNRLIIYPKDIMQFTGISERQARYLLDKIKTHLCKEPHQWVTVAEFCRYMGLNPDEVLPNLR